MRGGVLRSWRGRVARLAQLMALFTLWLIPAAIAVALTVMAQAEDVRSLQPRVSQSLRVGITSQPKERAVRVSFPGASSHTLLAPVGGTVVWRNSALLGALVRDGDLMLQVGPSKIVANVGSLPFYRPLTRGAKGDDVRRLNEMLHHAGLTSELANPSTFTQRTAIGIGALNRTLGLSTDTPFDPERTVFLPPGGLLESFVVDVGDPLTSGAPFAHRFSTPTTALLQTPEGKAIPSLPAGSIQAPDGAKLRWPTSANESQASELMRFSLEHGARRVDSEPGASGPGATSGDLVLTSLTYVVDQPREVATLPVSALFVRSDGRACVFEVESASQVRPRLLGDYTSGALGVIFTDVTLAGTTVLADASLVPEDVRVRC